ncbi:MAG: GTP 3',8-cyclase MoaA [Desulfobacterota bacterium]|nr:GTP 3',8-cyclase MoaA [Thermodesulfobacteriota bacterium]MDW8002505.1 GTP 3',8-cyclase MoaA [Deltaproteobacteria bacterium]
MLKDRFERRINYLRISITDRCNLKCRYCVDGKVPFVPHSEILSYEEITRFVRVCSKLGITKVRLTGGEPLLRKGLSLLIRSLTSIEGIEDISLTTNGVLLEEKISELKECGLKRINVSLDTLKKDRFRYITGFDEIEKVIRGIEKALLFGLRPVKINTVIIKGINDDEVVDFVEIASRLDLEIRFIEFMPFGEEGFWTEERVVPTELIRKRIEEHFELEPDLNSEQGPAVVYRIKNGKGKVGFISPVSSHLCTSCNRIRLTSRGRIKPCLFSDVEYDLKSALRSGASDEEIERLIVKAVKEKPERKEEHGLIRKCQRSLRHIGG